MLYNEIFEFALVLDVGVVNMKQLLIIVFHII